MINSLCLSAGQSFILILAGRSQRSTVRNRRVIGEEPTVHFPAILSSLIRSGVHDRRICHVQPLRS